MGQWVSVNVINNKDILANKQIGEESAVIPVDAQDIK